MADFPYLIRPVDSAKDAEGIAALILECFHPWLNRENVDYLRQLASAGKSFREKPFLMKLTGGFPYELAGVVCVDPDSGRIIGNTGVYHYRVNGVPGSLIANVCVDSAYRGQGIAARMLEEAERNERRTRTCGFYLQARMEVPSVIKMYRENGFRVTDYRNEWILPRGKALPDRADGLTSRRMKDAALFQKRFYERYPRSILWNLGYNPAVFDTNLLSVAGRRLQGNYSGCREFVNADGAAAGWAGWQRSNEDTDTLWLIPNGKPSSEALSALLHAAVKAYPGRKPLKIDTPAEDSARVYTDAGFAILHALAWMWKPL